MSGERPCPRERRQRPGGGRRRNRGRRGSTARRACGSRCPPESRGLRKRGRAPRRGRRRAARSVMDARPPPEPLHKKCYNVLKRAAELRRRAGIRSGARDANQGGRLGRSERPPWGSRAQPPARPARAGPRRSWSPRSASLSRRRPHCATRRRTSRSSRGAARAGRRHAPRGRPRAQRVDGAAGAIFGGLWESYGRPRLRRRTRTSRAAISSTASMPDAASASARHGRDRAGRDPSGSERGLVGRGEPGGSVNLVTKTPDFAFGGRRASRSAASRPIAASSTSPAR